MFLLLIYRFRFIIHIRNWPGLWFSAWESLNNKYFTTVPYFTADGDRAAVIIYCKVDQGRSPALSQCQREGSGPLRCGRWSSTHSSAGANQSPQFHTLPSSNPSPYSRGINENLFWFLNSQPPQSWLVNISFPSFNGEEKEHRPLFWFVLSETNTL